MCEIASIAELLFEVIDYASKPRRNAWYKTLEMGHKVNKDL